MSNISTTLPKSYYLPTYRAIIIGLILIVMGISVTFIGVDLKRSLWENLQWAVLNFSSVGNFIVSFIMLLFKAGFIIGGYLFIKFAKSIERAKLDEKGFYYREIPKGSGISKIAMDSGPLTFIPYTNIKEIYVKDSFFGGRQLFITAPSGTIPLITLGVLSKGEKQEIVETISSKINQPKLNR